MVLAQCRYLNRSNARVRAVVIASRGLPMPVPVVENGTDPQLRFRSYWRVSSARVKCDSAIFSGACRSAIEAHR